MVVGDAKNGANFDFSSLIIIENNYQNKSLSVLSEFEIDNLVVICPHAFFTNLWFTEFCLIFVLLVGWGLLWIQKKGKVSFEQTSVSFLNLFYQIFETINIQVKENFFNFQAKFNILFFVLFFVILSCNVFGLLPFFFTLTTHLFFVFFFSFFYFVGSNLLGIVFSGFEWFSLFIPGGIPEAIEPLLVIIEFASYLGRLISLTVRLFANMLAGHALTAIITEFSFEAQSFWNFFDLNIIGILLFEALFSLEGLVAFLQAVVFMLMNTLYCSDLINGH